MGRWPASPCGDTDPALPPQLQETISKIYIIYWGRRTVLSHSYTAFLTGEDTEAQREQWGCWGDGRRSQCADTSSLLQSLQTTLWGEYFPPQQPQRGRMTHPGPLSQGCPRSGPADSFPGALPHSCCAPRGTGVGAFHPGAGHLVWGTQHPRTPG